MPARKKPQHRITTTFHQVVVPAGGALELAYDDHHDITVLDATPMGPDVRFSYVVTKYESPPTEEG